MAVVVLFGLLGLLLVGGGFSRGNPLAIVLGGFLLADAVLFYLILGPVASFARVLLHGV